MSERDEYDDIGIREKDGPDRTFCVGGCGKELDPESEEVCPHCKAPICSECHEEIEEHYAVCESYDPTPNEQWEVTEGEGRDCQGMTESDRESIRAAGRGHLLR